MIKILKNILLEASLINTTSNVVFNVYIARSYFIQIICDHKFLYSAKISRNSHVHAEYEATVIAHGIFGSLVPEPLVCRRDDAIEIAVWRAVPHVLLDLRRPSRQKARIRDGLESYFRLGREHLSITGASESHEDRYLHRLDRLRASQPDFCAVLDKLKIDRALLNRQPHVHQHGDFWTGNLGFSGNKLIIFDWEDFGKTTLFGLDICIFIVSALRFDPAAIANFELRGQSTFLDKILDDFCHNNDLDRATFFKLLEVYLIEFLWLKVTNSYSKEISNKIKTLLELRNFS